MASAVTAFLRTTVVLFSVSIPAATLGLDQDKQDDQDNQNNQNNQNNIPLIRIGVQTEKAAGAFGLNLGLIELADGRVLYNDAEHRRLLLFNGTMSTFVVVGDSTGSGGFTYGRGAVPLI